MSVPILRGIAPHGDLYNRALSAIYKYHIRIIDPDYALQNEPEVWEKMWRDPKIAQAMRQRLHAVGGGQWVIEGAGKEDVDHAAAEICEVAMKKIRRFNESRFELCQAIFRGRSYAYIEGRRTRTRLTPNLPVMNWWLPKYLQDIDKRRFQIVPTKLGWVDGKPVKVTEQLWNVSKAEWEDVVDKRAIVRFVYANEEARLGYGRGLMESLYFMWWAKQTIWEEGLQGLERWSQGIIVGKVNTMREGGTDTNNLGVANELLDVLHEMRSRHVIVTGTDDEIEVVTGGMEGHQMVMAFLNYIDSCILGLIMGSVMPFGGQEMEGSFARSETETETSERLMQFDRSMLDETLSETLLRLFWTQNQSNLKKLGLGDVDMPHFKTTQQERENAQIAATVISTCLTAGIKLKSDEVYQKIGFTKPGEQDDIIETPQDMQMAMQQAQMAMGMGGGEEGADGGQEGGGGEEKKSEEKKSPAKEKTKKAS